MASGHAYCKDCEWNIYEENDSERSRLMLKHAIESNHDVTAAGARPIHEI
jgi:hypothetical protein